MIVGFTGPECSGKDTATAYLAGKGFLPFSLSDQIRKECAIRGLDTSTPTLVRVANELRQKEGADILARRALTSIDPTKNYVANSLRNPAEVEYLRKHGNLVLVLLDANPMIRWQRHTSRDGRSKYTSFADFTRADEEQKSADPLKQQLHVVFSMADHKIVNGNDVPAFYRALDAMLLKYRR